MPRKRVALVLPIRFAVRAFLQTEVLSHLQDRTDVLLVSPFADSPDFRQRFNTPGTEHALLKDFKPGGVHARWFSLKENTLRRRLNLIGLNVRDHIDEYYHNHTDYQPHLLREIKRSLRKRWIPEIAANTIGIRFLRWAERTSFKRTSYLEYSYYLQLFRAYSPDLVVSTSPNRPQEMPVARAVENLGIPHLAYILSFDNIICYGDYPRIYGRYLVWNQRNKREILQRYPIVKENQIDICGPLQFDVYSHREQYLIPRKEWAQQHGLSPESPVILYAETGHAIAPHEPAIVADLCQRLRNTEIHPRPTLLVRLHPMYPESRWQTVRKDFPEVRFQCPNRSRGQASALHLSDHTEWNYTDLAQLINTLHHSMVHVNVASTMALDAAYFDRPVIGIAYDARQGSPYGAICRRLYEREHYIDIVRFGGLALARSAHETLTYIRSFLSNPSLGREKRRLMVQAYDPFMDGLAAKRVAEAILAFL